VSYREKEQVLDETKSLPTQFSTLDAVLHRHVQRIANTWLASSMLTPCLRWLERFLAFPLKPNTSTQKCGAYAAMKGGFSTVA
jgi:hypothetical protein